VNHLLGTVVRGYRGAVGCGLPIGSLVSQHAANFYLGWFDRFVKERLRIPGYVRYMDDLALWADDPEQLRVAEREASHFLADELALLVKPHPAGRKGRSSFFGHPGRTGRGSFRWPREGSTWNRYTWKQRS
jgi:hypothetical protein